MKPRIRRARGRQRIPKRPCRPTKLVVALTFSLMLLACAFCVDADGVRIRDLTMIAGARDNQLVGYGLVAGLPNAGDRDPNYTQQTVANMLRRFGITVPATTLSAKNVAVVMVTADVPPFVEPGQRLDVEVASMGDAQSLQGGVLLQTPLLGADNKVYAVAQGALTVGGFTAGTGGGGGATVTKNIPTTAQIIGGALVETAIPTTVVHDDAIELLLRDSDFISAARMAAAINATFPNSATALNSGVVRVELPKDCGPSPVDFIASLQDIEVKPDVPARIIINERTGTIVATADIQISSCAISQGNITINVASTLNVSQPSPFSSTGQTVVTPSTTTDVTENKSSVVALPELPTVEKVAAALNTLGATPRDIMAIFEAMKQAGALQAQLIIR
ncbi:MAG TPA: flagellar basal body P-ring protein FlgI [Candidatus Saccharimonadales bacterium]|nr:flagellar basal body P-ring protein FlgI [Candidatus Saccharimonadales bacterium]